MDREDVEDFKDIYDPQNEENTSEAQREAAQAAREALFPAGFDPALAASGKSAGAKRSAGGGQSGDSAAKRAAVVAGVDDAAFKAKYDANQVGEIGAPVQAPAWNRRTVVSSTCLSSNTAIKVQSRRLEGLLCEAWPASQWQKGRSGGSS